MKFIGLGINYKQLINPDTKQPMGYEAELVINGIRPEYVFDYSQGARKQQTIETARINLNHKDVENMISYLTMIKSDLEKLENA